MTSTEVDTMDAGSLRAAYKVLMNEHQVLLASYEGLVRQTVQLEQALAATDKLASEAAQRNEDMGLRVHELEVEIRRLRKYEHPRGMKPYKQQAEELRRSLLTAEDKIRYRDEVIDQRNGEIDRLFSDLAGALDLLRECAPILSGVGYHERRKRIDTFLSQQAKP